VDITLYCNSATSCFAWIPRLRRAKVVINPDGLEWERAKWGWAGKTFYKFSEHLAARFPHRIVSDSHVIQDHYKDKFGCDSEFVAYGADIVERGTGQEMLAEFGVAPEHYFLFVSRLEPENNAHLVVEAFEKVDTDMHLLIVGSAPFADDYIRRLTDTNDRRIIFPGALYGDAYRALRANAYVYVNAMEVGGTHPAILEAMGAGNCVLVSDTAYNAEAVAEAGVQFRSKDVDDCREKMQWLADHPAKVEMYRHCAIDRVRTSYNWEDVVSEYEAIFESLLKQ
jgi:glycosyltransferase involved in cell wall biosynthesis